MQVIRADVMGLCFGVRDALEVIDGIDEPATVTIHGQLVHNAVVQAGLAARGFALHGEAERRTALPETPAVLITAHGISDRERNRLETAGKRLLDTTCPLVRRVHQAAQALQAEGYHVLVIGRRGHVEVEGIVEDLDHPDVIESVDEVTSYASGRLGIVCQTTATERQVEAIRAAIAARNPHAEVRFVDTVCLPTKEHQRALERLLDRVEAVVVVGGRNSNNTRELVARCRERGKSVWHVQSAAELDPRWFDGCATVGLTAGTSTLPGTIEEVHRTLGRIGRDPDSGFPIPDSK
ncbi:MAG TPA: 4-hydroxy-3-methylbut-2-enyl diphosphate reductase [Isosphaeraceae bacterium]|nr:4-hydroxy-3-methylbut-2-enyl diphosphate reductase [Isosphaeraceae bacterium]